MSWKLPKYIFHGIRLHRPDKELAIGLKPWDADRAREELLKAFKYFNANKLEDFHDIADNFFVAIEQTRFGEPLGFWFTIDKNAVPFWAKQNPEIISLPLVMLGIDEHRVYRYLEKTYGHPYGLTIDLTEVVNILGEERVRHAFLGTGGADMFLPLPRLDMRVVKFWYPV